MAADDCGVATTRMGGVHVHEGATFIGNTAAALIDQIGESVVVPDAPFRVVWEFEHLRP
jgi:hypothetical protein